MQWHDALALCGGVLTLAVGAAGLAVIRTKTNSHRLDTLEEEVKILKSIPARMAALERTVEDQGIHARDERSENRSDHQEIKRNQSDFKREVYEKLDKMAVDILNAIKNTNGGRK